MGLIVGSHTYTSPESKPEDSYFMLQRWINEQPPEQENYYQKTHDITVHHKLKLVKIVIQKQKPTSCSVTSAQHSSFI